jgi:hypothetical protein
MPRREVSSRSHELILREPRALAAEAFCLQERDQKACAISMLFYVLHDPAAAGLNASANRGRDRHQELDALPDSEHDLIIAEPPPLA